MSKIKHWTEDIVQTDNRLCDLEKIVDIIEQKAPRIVKIGTEIEILNKKIEENIDFMNKQNVELDKIEHGKELYREVTRNIDKIHEKMHRIMTPLIRLQNMMWEIEDKLYTNAELGKKE